MMPVRAARIVRIGLLLGVLSSEHPHFRSVPIVAAQASAPRRGPAPHAAATVLRGRVLLPDDGSPLGIRAWLATPTSVDSVSVDVTGAFTFTLPRIECDSVDIRLDADGEIPRRYHPAVLRVRVPTPTDTTDAYSVRALLVPITYTVSGGTFAGATVPISISDALAAAGQRSRYWRVSRFGQSRGVPIGWPEDRFPVPLAVTGHSSPLRSADSGAVWMIARQLERDYGRTLFRPISADSARDEGWSITLSLNPLEDTPGITFITYDARGDLYESTIAIRSSALLGDSRVVTHELLHALGFGHSVGWYSVMSAPFQAASRASASDIAYAQLFYRLRRVHIEQRATHGILESTPEALRRGPLTATPRGCPMTGRGP
jgi:hypothetical protein